MFSSDFADTCPKKIPLVSMGPSGVKKDKRQTDRLKYGGSLKIAQTDVRRSQLHNNPHSAHGKQIILIQVAY